jgi:uncharacterized membrane protein
VRVKLGNGLILLNILNILLIIIVIFLPSKLLQIILGIPFILFSPGYTLMAALYPKKTGVGGIERIALSFGLSIASVGLLMLVLNYTTWGITLGTILYSIASSMLIVSVIAYFRQRRLTELERFSLEFQLRMPNLGASKLDRALSIVLVVVALAALSFVIYTIATPKPSQTFTEFYLPEAEMETASNTALKVGEENRVTIGIVNYEDEKVSYHIEVMIDGIKNSETAPIQLDNEEKWEGPVSFTPNKPGHQKVEFYLYKEANTDPYMEPLRLWMDFISIRLVSVRPGGKTPLNWKRKP